MKISYSWLKTYFKEEIPTPEKLAELFNAHAFEVEGVETVGEDTVLDIKVLPDRAHYALSHWGIAREVFAMTGIKPTIPETQVVLTESISAPKARIETRGICNRYMVRRVDNVTVGESPLWLKKSLEAIAARSINNIVDATNYTMFDKGQPIHAFDADKIVGELVVRKALPNETIVILDGREMKLLPDDIVIADDVGPLAIAGVKGGKRAEVNETTKSLILESVHFNPTNIRKTSTRLGLRSEASKRFENEITAEYAPLGLLMVTSLVQKLCVDAKAGLVQDVYPDPVKSRTLSVNITEVSSLVGIEIPTEKFETILTRLGIIFNLVGERYNLEIPHDRLDLTITEDIADEVGRLYGYGAVPAVQTPALPGLPADKEFVYAQKVKDLLVGKGFSETLLYSLVPKGYFEIAYPLASDKSAMRETIAPLLTNALVFNARNADLLLLDVIKIFEIGNVFPSTGEHASLCIGVQQIKKQKGVTSESVLKETVAFLEQTLNTALLGTYAVKDGLAVFEINFTQLVAGLTYPNLATYFVPDESGLDKKYKPFSVYPYMVRDIAVFVPKEVSKEEVFEIIKTEARELLEVSRLFDVFTKAVDGKEMTSYAYRLVFQSHKRTLEEGEVNAIMEKMTAKLNGKEGWKVR